MFKLKSLKSRLIISAMLLISIVVPLAGITLSTAFETHLRASIENEMSALSYTLLTVAEVENGELLMPEEMAQSQFNVSESGVYGLISGGEIKTLSGQQVNIVSTLWTSASFLGLLPPQHLQQPATGDSVFYQVSFAGKQHFVYSFSVEFLIDNNQDFPLTLHIIKDNSAFIDVINEFEQQLWLWLVALLILLLAVQLLWLVWALKPLKILAKELQSIEQGKNDSVSAEYPLELQHVTKQLNTLLLTEQNQRKRYRNALSDLAHSLKTPIAVIQSQPNITKQTSEQVTVINNIVEHQLTRAQSAGDSAWHLSTEIAPVVNKLVNALTKIYQGKALSFQVNIASDCYFKGDETDLMEMIGNVLDNACKAAKSFVWLDCHSKNNQLHIVISDDGKGIAKQDQNAILNRGVRADSYEQGHGIGLAIVKDLVESYQGVLSIHAKDIEDSDDTILNRDNNKKSKSHSQATSKNTTFTLSFKS